MAEASLHTPLGHQQAERSRSRRHLTRGRRGATAGLRRGAIAVAVDGRGRSQDALALAAALGERTGADLLPVHVHPYGPFERVIGDDGYEALVQTGLNASFLRARSAVGEHHARQPRALPDAASAAGLQRIAESEGARMIVVGAPHRVGIGRLRPGAIAESLLPEATVPVAVAPSGYAAEEPRLATIAYALDEPARSSAAAGWARELARATGAQIREISARSARDLISASRDADLLVMGAGDGARRVIRHASSPVVVWPGVDTGFPPLPPSPPRRRMDS